MENDSYLFTGTICKEWGYNGEEKRTRFSQIFQSIPMTEEFEDTRTSDTDKCLIDIIKKTMHERERKNYYMYNDDDTSFYGEEISGIHDTKCTRDRMDVVCFNMALLFGSLEVVKVLCLRYGKSTCFKGWKKGYKPSHSRETSYVYPRGIFGGKPRIPIVEWILEETCPLKTRQDAMTRGMFVGNPDLVKFAMENGCGWNHFDFNSYHHPLGDLFDFNSGHVEIFEWLVEEKGYSFEKYKMYNHIRYLIGHLDIEGVESSEFIKFLMKNGCHWENSFTTWCIMKGGTDLLKWSYANVEKFDVDFLTVEIGKVRKQIEESEYPGSISQYSEAYRMYNHIVRKEYREKFYGCDGMFEWVCEIGIVS